MQYYEYLNSKEWKNKKKSLSGIGGRRCWICGKRKTEAHHATYKNLGNENIHTDLYFLCREHHQAVHDLVKVKNINIYHATHEVKKKHVNKKGFRWGGRERWEYWNTSQKLQKRGL